MLSPLRPLLLGLALAGSAAPTRALEPFVASYQAYNEGKTARTNTTSLGAEAAAQTPILNRRPRVVGLELAAGADA